MFARFFFSAFSLLLLLETVAHGALVSIASDSAQSTENLASFTGTLDYTPINASSGTLAVSLTNTSDSGFLVAFAFNNPFNSITGVTVATASNLDNVLGAVDFQNEISVSPFGDGDIGASLTTSWVGGGSPNGGIAASASGSWVFTLSGSNMNTLSTQDFVDNVDMEGEFFLVRFRGIETGAGSDKVPAQVVPESSSFLLIGAALAGFVLRRRRAAA